MDTTTTSTTSTGSQVNDDSLPELQSAITFSFSSNAFYLHLQKFVMCTYLLCLFCLLGLTCHFAWRSPIPPSVGNLETLDKQDTLDYLWAFYQQYYGSASNMRLVVVGQEPVPQLQEWVQQYFAAVPAKSPFVPQPANVPLWAETGVPCCPQPCAPTLSTHSCAWRVDSWAPAGTGAVPLSLPLLFVLLLLLLPLSAPATSF